MADVGFGETGKRKREADPRQAVELTSVKARLSDLRGGVLRQLAAILGVAFAVAGLSLWFVPGASYAADLLAMKIAVTTALFVGAVFCWGESKRNEAIEVQVDFNAREVRFVDVSGREALCRETFHFDHLLPLQVRGHILVISDPDQGVLAELPLEPALERRLDAFLHTSC